MHALIENANALVADKPDLSKVLEGLKDQSIDFHVRWEAYKILVKGKVITDIETYGDGYVSTLINESTPGFEYSLYDDMYMEKYESLSWLSMYDRLKEWDGEKKEVSEESLRAWQERVLASGNAGFKWDW